MAVARYSQEQIATTLEQLVERYKQRGVSWHPITPKRTFLQWLLRLDPYVGYYEKLDGTRFYYTADEQKHLVPIEIELWEEFARSEAARRKGLRR